MENEIATRVLDPTESNTLNVMDMEDAESVNNSQNNNEETNAKGQAPQEETSTSNPEAVVDIAARYKGLQVWIGHSLVHNRKFNCHRCEKEATFIYIGVGGSPHAKYGKRGRVKCTACLVAQKLHQLVWDF